MRLARIWWTLGVLLVIAAAIFCLIPSVELPSEFELNDKTSHLVGHGALALYFAGLVPRRGWWKIFVFLLCFGTVIELAQYSMHAGREGDPRDVVANSLGAVLGLLVARCGVERWPEFAAWLLGRRTAE